MKVMGFTEVQSLEIPKITSQLRQTTIIKIISVRYKTKINLLKSSPILMITTIMMIPFLIIIKNKIPIMVIGEIITPKQT